jgi:hypothetical protein
MGCDTLRIRRSNGVETGQIRPTEGPGGAVCVARRLAIWGAIRSNANSRVEGWGAPGEPSIYIYDSRGFNPVLTEGRAVQVVWLDGDHVVKILPATAGENGLLVPPVEVTTAIVLPRDFDLRGLGEGDVVTVMGRGKE